MRIFLLMLALLPCPTLACKPAPNLPPPTVEGLLASSRYVVYAEVLEVTPGPRENQARIRTLENFKGEPITSLRSPAHSCGLHLVPGEKAVFFLDKERSGMALDYPYHLGQDEVLKTLRQQATRPRR